MKTFIRTKKSAGLTSLYAWISICDKGVNTQRQISLGMKVEITDWAKTFIGIDESNNPIQSETKVNNLFFKLGYLPKLQDIENALRQLREDGKNTLENVREAIETIVLADVRAEIDKQEEREKQAEERKAKDAKAYIDNFIKSLEQDTLTEKGSTYKYNSIKTWRQFHRIFSEFYKSHKVSSIDEIDKKYVESFTLYLKKHYLKSSVVRYVSCFGTILRRAETDKVRTEPITSKMFYRGVVKETDGMTEIYLTKDELSALYDMHLNGMQEQVRDVFLVGAFTAQRFSDYSRIDKSCIGTTAKGTQVIRLTQVKTGKQVVIPILDDRLLAILEKYDYTLPNLNDVVFNRYIKRICAELSKSVPSLAESVPTILNKTEREAEERGTMTFERDELGRVIKHRWELVQSHTARRTAITLMHLSGKYTILQMMSVSGHTKTETFFRYLRQSLDDAADNVADTAGADGLF